MIKNDELSRIAEAEFKDLDVIEKAIHLLYCDVEGYEEYANDAAAKLSQLNAELSESKQRGASVYKILDIGDNNRPVEALSRYWVDKVLQLKAEREALEKQRDGYMNRVARLEAIIRAAKSGEYDNAHEIHAIRKFLYNSMQEYEIAIAEKGTQ